MDYRDYAVKFKLLLTFFLLIVVTLAESSEKRCDLFKRLNDPDVRDHQSFWNDYNKMTMNGEMDDQKLGELLKSHGLVGKAEQSKISSDNIRKEERIQFSTSKKADREIAVLQPHIKSHFEDFVRAIEDTGSLQSLYANPGKWHMEKMHGPNPKFTVRLSKGYRVLFSFDNNELVIHEINKNDIHSNTFKR